ncbi:hypothetical protein EVAR_17987_1 [Eumeta japonica]|uniref:Uncharacterized protein n=1 Tax=Eumeta variegata TaxID=151549 RepID=A0A4C1Y8F3_EUMVA|nr:hypothetical protein EVAR_17987_1 [Eumeta japonica]
MLMQIESSGERGRPADFRPIIATVINHKVINKTIKGINFALGKVSWSRRAILQRGLAYWNNMEIALIQRNVSIKYILRRELDFWCFIMSTVSSSDLCTLVLSYLSDIYCHRNKNPHRRLQHLIKAAHGSPLGPAVGVTMRQTTRALPVPATAPLSRDLCVALPTHRMPISTLSRILKHYTVSVYTCFAVSA